MKSILADGRPTSAESKPLMAESFPRPACVLGVLSFLALATTAGALILGTSPSLARAGALAQRAEPPAGNAQSGKQVYSTAGCAVCHGDQGQGGKGDTAGPQIAALTITLPRFVNQVRNPKDQMPPYPASKVSDAALSDVYAFLKSMAPPSAQPTLSAAANAENGKRLYVSAGCYECHNREGQGGDRTGPRLAPNPIAFAAFLHQLREPSNQMPPYTGKVLSDGQVSDIYVFLQSIPPPPAVSSIPLLQ